MTDNREITESHGCIVCGRSYNMLVVYSPAGKFIDAAVTSAGGRRVPDPERPLAVCETHAQAEIDAALARRKAREARQHHDDHAD